MRDEKLFMLLLGCRPTGRYTEQHDVFFGIAPTIKDLIPAIKKSWPEAKGNIHIDAWREVKQVDGFSISVIPKDSDNAAQKKGPQLFFINLGGYKEREFDEFHYKMLVVANDLDEAKKQARKTAFFKHTSLPAGAYHPKATSHIDDKYGVDVDDFFNIEDILPAGMKALYGIDINAGTNDDREDPYNLGYFKLSDL